MSQWRTIGGGGGVLPESRAEENLLLSTAIAPVEDDMRIERRPEAQVGGWLSGRLPRFTSCAVEES